MSSMKSMTMGLVLFLVAILFLSAIDVPTTLSAKESASAAVEGFNSVPESTVGGAALQGGNNQLQPTVFGGQIAPGSATESITTLASQANLSWIRYDGGGNQGVLWSEIEAQQGVRDWSHLDLFEEEIPRLSEAGLIPIVLVRQTPSWAQKDPPRSCGPIREDALDDFADFMRKLVERYSGPPYNVTYWEIGNEPDIDGLFVSPDHFFGCWGDLDDAYYGGGYYAEMLKHVYPAMKEADPNAQVVIGGLNLDCDPTNLPDFPNPIDPECKAGKFLEGILRNGGGDYFDIIAYHGYPFWNPAPNGDWDLEHGKWRDRGGVTIGKAHFLREVLAEFGYEKPLILAEVSLLCHEREEENQACPGDEFFAAQANYLIRLYARLWANKVLGATWFNLHHVGWRHSDLLHSDETPKPAYEAMQFMSSLLSGTTYKGSLASSTVEGYLFWNSETNVQYQIYWTNHTNTTESLSLPAGTRKIYDKLGQEMTPSESGTIEITFEPIIIEMESRFIYLPLLQR